MDFRAEYREASGHIPLVPIAEGYHPEGEYFSVFYVEWLERELYKARQNTNELAATDSQQRYAKIADEMDGLIRSYSIYWTSHCEKLREWSRQLRQ